MSEEVSVRGMEGGVSVRGMEGGVEVEGGVGMVVSRDRRRRE